GAALETGQIKSSLFSGSDWKRPIIQFVESSDEKRSTYFSMDSADSKKMQFASGQIGDMRRPALSFPEKGDLRKSLFSLDSKKSFLPGDGEGRKRPFNKADRAAGSRPRVKLEDVLCDSCIDNKQKAVKSCLVCQASFCELHLKPHLEGAAFRDHQLLDPIRDFEARKCPVHGKTMELFCQTDQMCICYLCMFQEHKNHSTVTVEIEKAGKEVISS
ncbi:TRI29 protein, partial [Pomatostomus ruficeps]|nr:TRI29 protein [Pomatostomus ruficeps]